MVSYDKLFYEIFRLLETKINQSGITEYGKARLIRLLSGKGLREACFISSTPSPKIAFSC